MRKLFILFGFTGVLAFNACTDHEIIPPPVPLVDLNCECEALIDDTLWVYDDECYYESVKNIVTEGLSSARYITSVEEEDIAGGLEIEMMVTDSCEDVSAITLNADDTNSLVKNYMLGLNVAIVTPYNLGTNGGIKKFDLLP